MQTRRLAAAAALGASLCTTAFGQKISDDVVKIGVLTDMTGAYSDVAGRGSVAAARLAVQDFSKDGTVLGKKIEILTGDHQLKADVASSLARQWFDREKVDMITDLAGSNATLAAMEVAEQKKKVMLVTGGFSMAITNERCNPYTVQWVGDFYPLTASLPAQLVKGGKRKWFFITADYGPGHYLEGAAADAVKRAGGEVAGTARAPLGSTDFSSYIVRAQATKADVIALASTGQDAVNAIRGAADFGAGPASGQTVAPLFLFITEIDSLGLAKMQGLNLIEYFYWNQSERSRTWARRFFAVQKRMPTSVQAGVYSSVLNYLRAVQAAGTDDAEAVMKELKSKPIDDGLFKGTIRADGRFVHDMLHVEVKKPADSTTPWDYYNVKAVLPGEAAAQPLAESKCKLVTR